MNSLAVGFLGALVGGALGLIGAWKLARSQFKAIQMVELRALISGDRARLAALYAPVIGLVWALERVVTERGALYQTEDPVRQRARHLRHPQ